MKKAIKKGIFSLIFQLCYSRSVELNDLLVLTYHRISDKPDFHDSLKVSLESFINQIRFIRKHYNVISAEDFAKIILEKKSFPKRSCLVTFDDGWKDNFTNAFPVLKKYEVPAIIFVSTDYIDTNRTFWHKELVEFLMEVPLQSVIEKNRAILKKWPNELLQRIEQILKTQTIGRMPLMNDLISHLKAFQLNDIYALIKDLHSALCYQQRSNYSDVLSWAEIAEMAENNISFGSHTKSHSLLTNLSDEKIEEELGESKKIIEAKTGRPVYFIAYPNGNYNPSVLKIAEKTGYLAGFTCVPGINLSYEKPFELKRKNVLEECSIGINGKFSDFLFRVELSGIRDDLRRWVRREAV